MKRVKRRPELFPAPNMNTARQFNFEVNSGSARGPAPRLRQIRAMREFQIHHVPAQFASGQHGVWV